MPFQSAGELRYYTFDIFEGLPLQQAIFTRRGGVSPAPWNSLNVGGMNGDERSHVIENRERMFATFGRRVETLFDVWQVHSTRAIASDHPRPLDSPHAEADIILTDRPEITLFMRFGDCVPVLLYDPHRKVACLAHAGWKGTVDKASAVAVQAMKDHYGSQPQDILAGIGPSIGPHHYPVGQEVIKAVEKAFGEDAPGLLSEYNDRIHFDLWEANRLTLEQAGVWQVQIAGVCTACSLEDWFSHRGEHGKTGRFGALLALSDGD
jgi:polyphenol oxidase